MVPRRVGVSGAEVVQMNEESLIPEVASRLIRPTVGPYDLPRAS
jgi:hypothetical protein